MAPRRFEVASTAYRWAARQRTEKGDRLVLACEVCPETRPSKRRPPRWSVIARAVAERFDLQAAAVRQVLTDALEAERGRGAG